MFAGTAFGSRRGSKTFIVVVIPDRRYEPNDLLDALLHLIAHLVYPESLDSPTESCQPKVTNHVFSATAPVPFLVIEFSINFDVQPEIPLLDREVQTILMLRILVHGLEAGRDKRVIEWAFPKTDARIVGERTRTRRPWPFITQVNHICRELANVGYLACLSSLAI